MGGGSRVQRTGQKSHKDLLKVSPQQVSLGLGIPGYGLVLYFKLWGGYYYLSAKAFQKCD